MSYNNLRKNKPPLNPQKDLIKTAKNLVAHTVSATDSQLISITVDILNYLLGSLFINIYRKMKKNIYIIHFILYNDTNSQPVIITKKN